MFCCCLVLEWIRSSHNNFASGTSGRVQEREGDLQELGVWWHVDFRASCRGWYQRALGQTGYQHTQLPRQVLGQVCQKEGDIDFHGQIRYSIIDLFVIKHLTLAPNGLNLILRTPTQLLFAHISAMLNVCGRCETSTRSSMTMTR